MEVKTQILSLLLTSTADLKSISVGIFLNDYNNDEKLHKSQPIYHKNKINN